MEYYQKKALIDIRKHKKTAYKIQMYNNGCVDELVENFDDAGEQVKKSSAMLWSELYILNKPEVYKNYNRIMNSKYTSNSNFQKLILKNKANADLNRIVEAEVERISKNLDYVEEVMKKYEIPSDEYKKLVKQQSQKSLANRQKILNELAIKKNELLVSEGINIPSNVFSYRDLETTAQSLVRQSQMTSEHERILAINKKAVEDGKDEIYTHKVWIHTGAGETTRHMSNHMQKVLIDEPFIVVNDKTLDIDEMMYPCDPAGSPSNAYICYCECAYENEDGTNTTFWDI